MAQNHGSVRIGPVSILVLVIMLCLAVMAVLTLATASSDHATTLRQEQSTTEMYANETQAQEFLAQLDAALQEAKVSGSGVEDALSSLDLPEGAMYENGILSVSFVQEGGRRLDVEISLPSTASYEILAWRASTDWNEDDPEKMLWSAS
jgi:hypothetical protein